MRFNTIKNITISLILIFPIIVLAAPAKKIIVLSPHAVEMLYAIGAGSNIIATTEYANFPDEAKNIPRIGGYYGIQIEKVMALNPDLIVTWSGGNKHSDLQQLKQLGLTLYDSNPTTLDSLATELENLGQLTGHSQQANKVATQYRQLLQQIAKNSHNKPKVRVFYQLWSEPLMTVARNSWIQQIIEVCRGDNVFAKAANDYPQLSIENVLLNNPQVIIQSQQQQNEPSIAWQQWPEISAVKNHHIYQINADLLHRPSPRTILGIQTLCNTLDKVRNEPIKNHHE